MVRMAMAVAVAAMLAACGTTEVVKKQTVGVSVGQQLIDLKRARDSGAMSEHEYHVQKEDLIRSVERERD